MGARVGRYELQDLLDKGGMGEVWRARDTELDRTVALKLLQRTTQEDLARFRREAHAVARLNHPNIAQLYEFGGDPPHLTGPGGFGVQNDDGPLMGTDSRLDVTLPADGTYTVTATSYRPGQSGAYVLRIWLRDAERRLREADPEDR